MVVFYPQITISLPVLSTSSFWEATVCLRMHSRPIMITSIHGSDMIELRKGDVSGWTHIIL